MHFESTVLLEVEFRKQVISITDHFPLLSSVVRHTCSSITSVREETLLQITLSDMYFYVRNLAGCLSGEQLKGGGPPLSGEQLKGGGPPLSGEQLRGALPLAVHTLAKDRFIKRAQHILHLD